ncbi:MAG TPA: DUF1385 domain-containing protein [Actinomycetota bacterium]|nr:DUF1385 domain-containing protein [Actinomycetota bacterium]
MSEEPGRDRDAHFYGGQAVLEGVMMRGRDHWAVAVRRPDLSVHLESHEIRSIARRHPWLGAPGLRGVLALGQALSIGVRALTISANQSVEDEEQLTPKQMAGSMVLAFTLFAAVFVVGPYVGFRFLRHSVSSSVWRNVLEGVARVALFLGYLALIGRMKEIRRVFEYHGAEHKTIAAYEHHEELVPERVDRFSTLHVRCGTNFLLIVMVLTIAVYSVFPARGLVWGIASRLVAIPLIAGISYELLRLGARFTGSRLMRAVMAPGLWLQKITTKPPSPDQIEVAIASFQEVLRCEAVAKEPASGP